MIARLVFSLSLLAAASFGFAEEKPTLSPQQWKLLREANQIDELLGRSLQRTWTNHFLILHDAPGHWATQTGQLLEQTHDIFFKTFGKGFSIDRQALSNPLLWIAMTNRDDYDRYASKADRVDMSWSQAYYSVRTNRVAIALPQRRTVVAVRETAGATAVDGATVASATLPDASTPLPRQLVLVGQVSHEAIHQLTFNSGLLKRGVMYPLWVSEGLATNFEMDHGGRFGLDRDNPVRRQGLIAAIEKDRLLPLETLIATTRVPVHRPDLTDELYAQCWAFFRFAYVKHRRPLSTFLADAKAHTGFRSPDAMRQQFRQAFGNPDALADDWAAFVKQLAQSTQKTSE